MQWLSDMTSNPPPRQRRAMPQKGFAINGGAPSRQLRRGIEPRLHKLRKKKPASRTCRSKQNGHQGNLRSRPIRAPSARKPHKGNKTTTTNNKLHKTWQPREASTPTKFPKKLGNIKQKDKVRLKRHRALTSEDEAS